MMTSYKVLGVVSLLMLAAILGLTIFILSGRHSRKAVYVISGTVLTLMIVVSLFCSVIYKEYHP